MTVYILWCLAGLVVGLVFASFFEWTLHKYVMHRPLWQLPIRVSSACRRAPQDLQGGSHSYHLIHEKDRHTIPMAWWNGPVLILLFAVPSALIAWPTGLWGLPIGAVAAFSTYYGVYEYIHWCMHLPKERRVEKPWLFRRLNGHHLLHHRYMHKNFNVVLPLADLCLGTLRLRASTRFAQATGPSVPDIQPQS
jgi:hypothetical protein